MIDEPWLEDSYISGSRLDDIDWERLTERQFKAAIQKILPMIYEASYLYVSLCEAGESLGIGREHFLRVRRDPVLAADLVLVIAGRATVLRSGSPATPPSDGICRLSDEDFDRLLGYFCLLVDRLPILGFARNILKDAGYTTIGDVIQLRPDELLVLPGRGRRKEKRIGESTLRNLRNELMEHGLRLGMQFSQEQLVRFSTALYQKKHPSS